MLQKLYIFAVLRVRIDVYGSCATKISMAKFLDR